MFRMKLQTIQIIFKWQDIGHICTNIGMENQKNMLFYHMLSFTNEWHVASLILIDINYRIDFVSRILIYYVNVDFM